MTTRSLALFLSAAAALAACKGGSPEAGTAKPAAVVTPALFAERRAVLDAIDAGQLQAAESALQSAPATADVHFLRARLAVARQDGETAFQEIKKAVEDAPSWPEYQYELGVIAPLPVGGLTDAQLEARFRAAGLALKKAVELAPDDPRYQYAYAFFLTTAPPHDGGNPGEGRKRFDAIAEKHSGTAWAHRVGFDRAAEREDFETAESEAAKTGAIDPTEGARLYLLVAGSRLLKGDLEAAKADLEAASKLRVSSAGGFCDAGFALDGGGNEEAATPFWKRCLELDPSGPKAAQARARLGTN